MRYSIPEMNMEALEKKLIRIKNKCAKYGCDFKYERVGEHFEEKAYCERDPDGCVVGSWKETIRYIDIDVEGTAAINGWRFAASLDFTDKGNIISKAIDDVEIPARYYDCAPWCEHCKTARDRKHSYIVFNEENGEFKQVGRSCLRDFTGGLSAEYVANFESFLKEVEEASEFRGLGGWGSSWFDVEKFMEYLAETIRIYGYVRRDSGEISTADRAEELYRNENGMRVSRSESTKARLLDAEVKGFKAENGKELAGKVREWILGNDREDNYFHNLKVACGLEYGGCKVLGLLASAFPAYDRELEFQAEKREREAKEAEAREKSSWMGKVGDKVSFKIADFRVLTSWETQWGMTMVYKFVSEDGLEATWKTGNWVSERCIGGSLTGKIKELKEYRGIKQTELTRCKVENRKEEKKPWNDEAQRAFEESYEEWEEGA